MRAIVLAAGEGTRLQPLTDSRPKCLVPIGGIALIDHQLNALKSVGVDDIVLVVGAKADQVHDHCGDSVRYIENPDFATTNSIYSLYLSSAELCSETFLLNCDILFDKRVLERMLDYSHGNILAVDKLTERTAGEMNVRLDANGKISKISKSIEPECSHAQSVQLIKFDSLGAQIVSKEVVRMISENNTDAFPTAAYDPLIDSLGLYSVDVGDLPWGEVDTLDDYQNAVDQVLPALVCNVWK